MPQIVVTGIKIDNKPIKQFTSFVLDQKINEHHSFSLVCPTEAIDGTTGVIFNQSKNLIGSPISVLMESLGTAGQMEFLGLVTQVETSKFSGHSGEIILSGFSPTILLDHLPHCQSWEEKNIKDIATDLTVAFPKEILSAQLEPAFKEKLLYTVQYKETSWQFLRRICSIHGEWLFYNGKKLVLGSQKSKAVKLQFGNNLSNFKMALEVKASAFQMVAYDYLNNEVYKSNPKNMPSFSGLNDLGKFVFQKSESFYPQDAKYWNNNDLTNKKQLDDFVHTRSAMQNSHMVQMKGQSGHPGLEVGGLVDISGKNVFNLSDESFGEYTVISIMHHCDGQGNYSNEFIAIPSSLKMPPTHRIEEPVCEAQSAMVTDNNDEKGLGRVRVKFHWMEGNEKSPWLRVTTPHAGSGKGMFLMPEKGEEVIVGFEGDSPTKPYVIGSVYNGKAKCSFANGGNDVKALQSNSGNKLVLNDKDQSVLIEDAKGNMLMIDGKGNINITSSESIKLTCGESNVELKKDGSVSINGKNLKFGATENLDASGGKKATMFSGQASFSADGGSNDANMSGKNANISGSMETNVSGGSKTTVSASGKVAVQGAIVALN
ncbi:type VI secretion system Vgr family protein [Cognataquiflexum rubidum]|uniref:type VI secretion system Vgr family protein n=1 Tax=Cognataquiflexum rubidum TaxID=2922273 RepID=UPI001F13DD53|nr:phage baseplate assembly protein V [Cognataquiflexum rubidum]MCH6234193.1 phage baseplate assembly protein V [Cognataquiflexum rubidum]